MKRYPLGAGFGEDRNEPRRERLIRRFVGPETKDAAGAEMGGELLQPRGLVERCILRVEQEVRRVVDVDQDGIKASSGCIRNLLRESAVSVCPSGNIPFSCQSMTASSASTMTSDLTDLCSNTACAV